MVKAIDFAVRTRAGSIVRGAVSGDNGAERLVVGSGEEISLNLSTQNVLGYERQGSDLILKLVDGREIVLSNFFETNGDENRLYLSSDSEVTQVFLSDAGQGALYANYGPVDTWSKYSTFDDLRFVDNDMLFAAVESNDETVGMAPFIPALLGGIGGVGAGTAAAVVGGAVVVGGLASGGGTEGGGGGTSSHTAATVNDAASSRAITTNSADTSITVTGTGHVGDTVVVSVGSSSQTTTIGSGGTWSVTIPGTNIPGDGNYEAVVTVTGDGYGPVTLDGPTYIIDMTPPDLDVTGGTRSTSHVENLADYQNGVTINGQGEPGAGISVAIGSATQTTTVGSNGNWSVTFTTAQIPTGEYSVAAVITSTDAMGNQTTLTETLVVDTVPNPLSFNTVAGDNVIDRIEVAGPVTVTGSSAAGAVITVTLDGASQQVTTNSSGGWSVTYPAGTFPTGEYNRVLTATTVDSAGNTSSSSHTVRIDTTTSVSFSTAPLTADNVINNAEASTGVTLTGMAASDTASVMVSWNGVNLPATVLNGQWQVYFPASSVSRSSGISTATVTATDSTGNTATATRQITLDRSTFVNFDDPQLGGDNIITGTEATNGITLTGQAEAGAQVAVEFQGTTRLVTASTGGTWSANFGSALIRRGTYVDSATVNVIDAAGNTDSTTYSFNVDTQVTNFARTTISTGPDNVLNNAEALSGLTVTGTVEPGSSVMVTFGTAGTFPAIVSGGTWSLTIPASAIPAGEAQVTLTARATDALGNVSAPYTEVVSIDRVVTPFAPTGGTGSLGVDGFLNAEEFASGLTLTGTAEPLSVIFIQLSNGSTQSVTTGTDGNWTATFAPAALPSGEVTLGVTVTATDLAGNESVFTDSVVIDTIAPAAPSVLGFSKIGLNVEGIMTETTDDTYQFVRVDRDGSRTDITDQNHAYRGNAAITEFEFSANVPDGSYLVVNTADQAGNSNSTLLVIDNSSSSTIKLARDGLTSFDFSTIDLSWAPDANMIITESRLNALTGPDQRLLVKGAADDTVTLIDATAAGQETVGTEVYNVYTLGSSGATILLDDDIQTVI